jgi:hypothetical protein
MALGDGEDRQSRESATSGGVGAGSRTRGEREEVARWKACFSLRQGLWQPMAGAAVSSHNSNDFGDKFRSVPYERESKSYLFIFVRF